METVEGLTMYIGTVTYRHEERAGQRSHSQYVDFLLLSPEKSACVHTVRWKRE